MTDDICTLLALSQLPRVPRGSVRRLMAWSAALGNALPSLLDAIAFLELQKPLPPALDHALTAADQVLDQCRALNITILQHGSAVYPTPLCRLAHPPVLLFVKGTFTWDRPPRIAVIGTRTPTSWGIRTARTCVDRIVACSRAGEPAEANAVVVSGLAPGIDTAAHEKAIAAGGRTWAVLAMGIDAITAPPQRALAAKIIDSGGALLSEYPPHAPARKRQFVARDRIQAGLSDAILLIESELEGGAMHTVRFAQRAGVPIWVTLPRLQVHQPRARDNPASARRRLADVHRGPSELLQSGTATRVTSAKALDHLIRSLPRTPAPADR
jgi:DNA processing protein